MSAAVLIAAACASPGMPPGGPPDIAAPELIGTAPDSGTTQVRPKEVVFRFNEVVAERSASATDLADLFLISPRDGTPRVSWNRDEIAVRPRSGWRPNTAYTVTMLRGISDIRGNVRNAGASTFFSTGPTVPRTRITGRVFDWVTGSPAPNAVVESFIAPDSTHAYVAITDTTGAFTLQHLPPGRYLVRGFVDRNRNRGIDEGEQWDSASVSLTDSSAVELLVFTRDSVAPRIREVASVDSLSLRVAFDKPVDPTQQLSVANFTIVGRDSVPLTIVSVSPPTRDTTPAAGVAPPARDTITVVPPAMSRPMPITQIVIRLARPLVPGGTYRVRALGLRGLLGITGDSERVYAVPAAAPPAQPDTVSRQAAPPPPQLPRR
ncbi:MAG: Ig-like domain-containing protein [Gemmatimonadaceae bacterium]